MYRSKITKLPKSFFSLIKLNSIHIGDCNGIRTLPESIGSLINLKDLSLCRTSINKLPMSIGKLSNLKSLILIENKITSLPASIDNLANLKLLDLRGNPLTDATKTYLDKLSKEKGDSLEIKL
jgi:leucine-rich repeat protein SHOC2